jgi:lysophospholipase L1-like esterase
MMHCSHKFLVLLPALVLSCAASAGAEMVPVTRVACVGDSITQGRGAPAGQSYPDQLGRMLGAKWKVHNFGEGGTTMLKAGDHPYWDTQSLPDALRFKPDVVIIMLGTNDTKPWNFKDIDSYGPDYKEMVLAFARLPGPRRILVCFPPPVLNDGSGGINEAGILAEIPIIRQVSKDTQAEVIDMFGALAGHADLQPDNVHPNQAGAELLARAAYKALTGQEFQSNDVKKLPPAVVAPLPLPAREASGRVPAATPQAPASETERKPAAPAPASRKVPPQPPPPPPLPGNFRTFSHKPI